MTETSDVSSRSLRPYLHNSLHVVRACDDQKPLSKQTSSGSLTVTQRCVTVRGPEVVKALVGPGKGTQLTEVYKGLTVPDGG